jgi:hypothetical protein
MTDFEKPVKRRSLKLNLLVIPLSENKATDTVEWTLA